MNYSGLSCEDVYINNARNKSGYYHINNEWVYCNMTAVAFSRGDLISSGVGVDGVWKRIASFNITAGIRLHLLCLFYLLFFLEILLKFTYYS